MKRTYIVSIQGTPETAERTVKLLDRAFRLRYNVHGVYRERSSYDAVIDTLTINVLMTADWMDDPHMISLFPEYQPKSIIHHWYHMVALEHRLDDVILGKLEEIQGRE